MANEAKQPVNIWLHEPVPYIVRVRVVVDPDRPPEVVVQRLVAYSVIEAVYQAIVMTTGLVDIEAHKIHVEDIRPDLPAYMLQVMEQAVTRASR